MECSRDGWQGGEPSEETMPLLRFDTPSIRRGSTTRAVRRGGGGGGGDERARASPNEYTGTSDAPVRSAIFTKPARGEGGAVTWRVAGELPPSFFFVPRLSSSFRFFRLRPAPFFVVPTGFTPPSFFFVPRRSSSLPRLILLCSASFFFAPRLSPSLRRARLPQKRTHSSRRALFVLRSDGPRSLPTTTDLSSRRARACSCRAARAATPSRRRRSP